MFEAALGISIILCALVAGLLFAFAVVAMPGLETLDDREFIRAFQVMDRVIQNNHPLFMLAWVGSVIALLGTLVIGLFQLETGQTLGLLILATAVYLLGVQLPTALVNIPLNNRLQKVDVDGSDGGSLARERAAFEDRWNRWNRIRTALAIIATALLVLLILQI